MFFGRNLEKLDYNTNGNKKAVKSIIRLKDGIIFVICT